MVNTAAERGREVRRRLTGAAVELIAEKGWTGVHTRVVAERAGVAPGLVHYHFASLQALLTEAAVGVLREAVAGMGPLFDAATTPDDLLDAILGTLERYASDDPASLLVSEAYLAATRDPELKRAVAEVVDDFRRDLTDWLRARGEATPRETAMVLAAAVDGVVLHQALSGDLTAATARPVLRRMFRSAHPPEEGQP
ncbi:TetR family transcriptional regulator [Saccharopolyspora erythraea NRRL 2338]|uniref:TetR/AcrR family transcriptional regulator n=1 Tax=Saccharopolyspora erythraea TaxID=1836 RepID=A0ABP3MSP5_SACER|nr:TetR/AcrR family transcriptional regulator [Saccharopolyspora erythraea]EQD83310.1 TetR family transcriptional regulator [Saccharopolyspora erythraea D]PFG94834.1 TetR family transcriptional regulator [Saccharopolyspora erythraea NRRL 2338]QRK91542.1 TetR/AcrR family transcriptional regulator [Saccharopolyspora erythraea]